MEVCGKLVKTFFRSSLGESDKKKGLEDNQRDGTRLL